MVRLRASLLSLTAQDRSILGVGSHHREGHHQYSEGSHVNQCRNFRGYHCADVQFLVKGLFHGIFLTFYAPSLEVRDRGRLFGFEGLAIRT